MANRDFFQRHLFTLLALLTIGLALAFVEQLQNLFELPPLALLGGNSLTLFWVGFLAVVGGAYLAFAIWIIRATLAANAALAPPPANSTSTALPSVPSDERGEKGMSRATSPQESARPNATRSFGPLVGGIGCFALAYALTRVFAEEVTWGIIERPFAWTACFFASAWGVWFLAYQLDRPRPLLTVFFRLLVSLCVINLLGECLWIGGNLVPRYFSFRIYSLWAILHIGYCLIMTAHVIDAVQFRCAVPIRAIITAGIIALIGAAGATNVGVPRKMQTLAATTPPVERPTDSWAPASERAAPEAPSTAATHPAPEDFEERVELSWLTELYHRLAESPGGDDPVVLIAASGGGSRAALFTALVLDDLARYPVQGFDVSRHTLLISSVSGGTLASATFVDRLRRQAHLEWRETPNNFVPEEVLYRMEQDATQFRDWLPEAKIDAYGERAGDYIETTWKSCARNELQEFHHSAFIDDMCLDFMAPLLRGALLPGVERGAAVQRFWERMLGLNTTNLDNFRDARPTGGQAPFLLCNTTHIHQGELVLLDFPPLPHDLFAGKRARRRGFPCAAVINLDPAGEAIAEIRLSEAVRMSANFPWGFASAQLRVGEADNAQIRLIDGGVFDNSGIAALRFVLDRLSEWEGEFLESSAAAAETGVKQGEIPPAYRLAHEVLERLRSRGVILIEIDSGKKPESPTGLAASLPALFDPKTALENAGYTHAEYDSREHLDRIAEILTDSAARAYQDRLQSLLRGAAPNAATNDWLGLMRLKTLHHLLITCNHEKNVMTAWALGPTDKAKVFVRFMIGAQALRDDLARSLEALRDCREHSQLVSDLAQSNVPVSAEQLLAILERGLALSEKGRLLQSVRNNAQTSQRFVFQQAAQRKVDFRKETLSLNLEPPKPNARVQELIARELRANLVRAAPAPPTAPPLDSPPRPSPQLDTPALPRPGAAKPGAAKPAAASGESPSEARRFFEQVDGASADAYRDVRENLLRKLPKQAPSNKLRPPK